MSKQKMMEARQLIQQKRYDEARKILKTVDHPTAREWLAKLDTAASKPKPISVERPKTSYRLIGLTIAVVGVGIAVIALVTIVPSNNGLPQEAYQAIVKLLQDNGETSNFQILSAMKATSYGAIEGAEDVDEFWCVVTNRQLPTRFIVIKTGALWNAAPANSLYTVNVNFLVPPTPNTNVDENLRAKWLRIGCDNYDTSAISERDFERETQLQETMTAIETANALILLDIQATESAIPTLTPTQPQRLSPTIPPTWTPSP